ncbi:DUF262 domain-containing protein [Streptomyces antimycoticus]|uniref:DUF262 domain-containing protein n=1 Tax=Streptomyces antimycoticus TaxID=68175 RepID=UPI00386981F5|nr:DUF262 domain-containing protein [Streptomyces antimycoticus]
MTRQTRAPLEHTNLSATYRQVRELVRTYKQELGLDLNPPYQRGQVWTEDQRVALVRSWLTGVPTGVVILSDRMHNEWQGEDATNCVYAVIDGKQRLTTAIDWYEGTLAVPASWINPEYIASTEDTDDGPYVRYTGLTKTGRAMVSTHCMLQVAEARVATVQEEAEIYLLVNGGGTPQTDTDMANATRIAQK